MGYIFAALASATAYGVADLAGGLAGRQMPVLIVALVANIVAAFLLTLIAVSAGDLSLSGAQIGEAVIAGVAMSIAGFLLYKALAIGPMSVAAPITAVTAIVIPVIYGVLQGDAISFVQFGAIAIAVIAIVLSSDDGVRGDATAQANRLNVVFIAIAAGVAIAVFYIYFERLSNIAGLWPLAIARYASLASLAAMVGLLIFAGRLNLRHGGIKTLRLPGVAGTADAAAIFFYYEAVRHGPIALVVTLASLYPVVTVALAVLLLKEKPTIRQWAGAGAALIAILTLASS